MTDTNGRTGAWSEELRRDIDSGRTGEKVASPDPATVPLGGDDEAAGRPPKPEDIARLRERERAKAPARRPKNARPGREGDVGMSLVPLAVVSALLAAALLVFALAGRL